MVLHKETLFSERGQENSHLSVLLNEDKIGMIVIYPESVSATSYHCLNKLPSSIHVSQFLFLDFFLCFVHKCFHTILVTLTVSAMQSSLY